MLFKCGADLPDQHHSVYALAWSKYGSKTMVSKMTHRAIQSALGIEEWQQMRCILDDLAECKFIEDDGHGHIHLTGPVCPCYSRGGDTRGSEDGLSVTHADVVTRYGNEHGHASLDIGHSNEEKHTGPSRVPVKGVAKSPVPVNSQISGDGDGWGGYRLAKYFRYRFRQSVNLTPGAVNVEATARHITTWIRDDGIDPRVVKIMIEQFSDQYHSRYRTDSTRPWKIFVYKCHELHEAARSEFLRTHGTPLVTAERYR